MTHPDEQVSVEYREKMNQLARGIDIIFNGDKAGSDRETGFVLLVFPFGEKTGRCNYISNGADRKDITIMFKEIIARFEGQPEMEGSA